MPLATEQTLRFSLARSPSPPIKIISISTWKLRSNYFFVGCMKKNPCTMNLKSEIMRFGISLFSDVTSRRGKKVCWLFKCVLAGDSNLCALQKHRTKFLLNICFVFSGSDEH